MKTHPSHLQFPKRLPGLGFPPASPSNTVLLSLLRRNGCSPFIRAHLGCWGHFLPLRTRFFRLVYRSFLHRAICTVDYFVFVHVVIQIFFIGGTLTLSYFYCPFWYWVNNKLCPFVGRSNDQAVRSAWLPLSWGVVWTLWDLNRR